MTPLPVEVQRAVVLDRGTECEVAVEQGFFLYVAWKQDTDGDRTTDPPAPKLVRTIPGSPRR